MRCEQGVPTLWLTVGSMMLFVFAGTPIVAGILEQDPNTGATTPLGCERDDICNAASCKNDPDCPVLKPPADNNHSQPTSPVPTTKRVTVSVAGSFTPKSRFIHDGDTVEWILPKNDYTDAIIPVDMASTTNVCEASKPYHPKGANEFTGPMPQAASGVFTLGPIDKYIKDNNGNYSINNSHGLVETQCEKPVVTTGNKSLCQTGELYKTMDSTWRDPDVSGVFIRLDWKEVEPERGVFKWDILDREIKKAVAHGKLYSLVFRAGPSDTRGTPEWVFKNPFAAQPLNFKDYTADGTHPECGWDITSIGGPNDRAYRDAYFGLLRAVGTHLRENNAWYRALAYIKPSGMNTFTAENWLPTHCDPNCTVCNTTVWAKSGYTPKALTEFYQEQMGVLAKEFPDKDMAYMLIQEGFPVVNNVGQYLGQPTAPDQVDKDAVSEVCKFGDTFLPYTTQQTECVLQNGTDGKSLHNGAPGTFDKMRFAVQHDGLGPMRDNKSPLNYLVHKYQLDHVVGFQTNNKEVVGDSVQLENSFQNGYCNSKAIFIEIYEERLWEIRNKATPDVLDLNAADSCTPTNWTVTSTLTPSQNRTLNDWAAMLHARRKTGLSRLNLPDPKVHQHTFKRTVNADVQTFNYRHGSKCKTADNVATVTIVPDMTTKGDSKSKTVVAGDDAVILPPLPKPTPLTPHSRGVVSSDKNIALRGITLSESTNKSCKLTLSYRQLPGQMESNTSLALDAMETGPTTCPSPRALGTAAFDDQQIFVRGIRVCNG
jgi:hypothetical protein